MASIAVPPLPVARFAEFKEFYERDPLPELWICGEDDHHWTWEDAGRVAANLYFVLGEPPIIAGREGDDALERWLAIFGTRHWCNLSQKMIAVPGVAGDGPRFLSPKSANIRRANIRRLNAWCLYWLTAFYAQVGDASAAAQTELPAETAEPARDPAPADQPAQTVEPAPDPAPSTTKRVRASPTLDRVEAAMRKDIVDGKLTLDELGAMTEEALKATYGTSRYTCRAARKRVLED